jgi:putative transposase
VIDLFSRKVVGWNMSDRLTTPLVTVALRNAIESRKPETEKLLHHSDRGCQYTSEAFQKIMRTTYIVCSMSRTGCCYDNAVMERFFWSLKHEWTKFEEFENLDAARLSVFRYIETFYNSERIHQSLDYQTPDQVERKYRAALAA